MQRSLLTLILSLTALMAQAASEGENVKSGWNFGPLPAVGYNSDMGFQYGALCEFYYFGDGSTFPEYLHKYYVEASAYTKGSTIFSFAYDSKYLIRGVRTSFNISYLPESMMSFYGFNGYMTPYDSALDSSFYAVNRDFFRTTLDLQGRIAGNFNWATGAAYYDYAITPLAMEQYSSSPSLYKEYLSEGIITEEESSGSLLEFKAGVVHDTRNIESDPTRGFWSELILTSSSNLSTGEAAAFGQFSFIHRGYIPVMGDQITFAYRAAYQGKTYGEIPLYQQSNMLTTLLRKTYSEGLGGVTSVRGLLRNRAVGEGYFMANAELRVRFCEFNFIGQQWYLAVNPFFDMGQVVDTYRADLIQNSSNPLIYSGTDESMHYSLGSGLYFIMNRNFVVGVEYGKALDPQDGSGSMSIGINFVY